jgi:hypothetical protein
VDRLLYLHRPCCIYSFSFISRICLRKWCFNCSNTNFIKSCC